MPGRQEGIPVLGGKLLLLTIRTNVMHCFAETDGKPILK